MLRRHLLWASIAALGLPGAAQNPRAFGTVSGYIYCNDTNTPARLASVTLRPAMEPGSNKTAKSDSSPAVEARVVHTGLDGSFAIPGVAPGTYLVIASLQGYVSPLAILGASESDLLHPDDELRKAILRVVPRITVEGAHGASVNIGLERGSAVSGTVLFDDGSPAAGINVQILKHKQGQWVPIETGSPHEGSSRNITDDRGSYRVNSVPPGKEYLVKFGLSLVNYNMYFNKAGMSMYSGAGFTLSFYTGGMLRPSAAKPFALTLGEDRPGEDIVLPLSKLHKVQGTVIAQHDGHVLNQASMELLFADDKSHLASASLTKPDARFTFPFVPEGDYILRVTNAGDARFDEVPDAPGSLRPTHSESHTLRTYGDADLRIHVDGDLLDLTAPVPDKVGPTAP
jgi:hypothetical protein